MFISIRSRTGGGCLRAWCCADPYTWSGMVGTTGEVHDLCPRQGGRRRYDAIFLPDHELAGPPENLGRKPLAAPWLDRGDWGYRCSRCKFFVLAMVLDLAAGSGICAVLLAAYEFRSATPRGAAVWSPRNDGDYCASRPHSRIFATFGGHYNGRARMWPARFGATLASSQ